MKFDYRARDRDGRPQQGRIEASSQVEALRKLEAQGLLPIDLQRVDAARTAQARSSKVALADKVVLLRELATLLGAGVTLGDALPSLAEAYSAHALGPALDGLNAHVRGGGRLSEALADPRLGMPAYALALAQAGEASGDLAQAMTEAADQMEMERKAADDLRSALVYPTVLVVAGVLAVLLIFVGVVPRFAPMLRSARGNVPEVSRWVIETGVFVRAHIEVFGLGTAALFLALGVTAAQPSVRQRVLQWMLGLPGIGPWLLQGELGRWATVLGALLANRVPIVEALELSTRVLKLELLRSGLERATQSLKQGQTLTEALESQPWFPSARLNLVRVGERSGELPRMLQALGHSQTDAARVTQKRLLTLIEPVAILVIGTVIGFVMVAVMMAITGMNDLTGR